MSTNTVGGMRQQSALVDSDTRIVIASDDPDIQKLNLVVVETYPDTVDERGQWRRSFKIKVESSNAKPAKPA